LSEKRACGPVGITRRINRYQSRRDPQDGYRRLTVMLRRDGWKVNAKRVYRIYRGENIGVSPYVPMPIASRLERKWWCK
jgi:putative transposase